MYAMVGTSKLSFENTDDAGRMANGVLSNLRDAPGFVSGSFARSTDGSHGRSMVLFESEEQARARPRRLGPLFLPVARSRSSRSRCTRWLPTPDALHPRRRSEICAGYDVPAATP